MVRWMIAALALQGWLGLAAPVAPGSPEDPIRAKIRSLLSPRLTAAELSTLEIPFAWDEAIYRRSREVIGQAHEDRQKLDALRAFFRSQGFLDRYDKAGTYSASETLRRGQGNCLSYANLFLAMARAVGLEAVFLDASFAHHEEEKSGRLLVRVGHVMVGVKLAGEIVPLDFDGRPKTIRAYVIWSDQEALAEFVSNLGFEALAEAEVQGPEALGRAVARFDLATRVAPRFARPWNNLGVALARSGRQKTAIEAYLRAIRLDPELPAPRANLALLLWRSGQPAQAVPHLQAAVRLDPANADYRFHLGSLLAAQGKPLLALAELCEVPSAARSFWMELLLAKLHLGLGRWSEATEAARSALQKVPNHPEAIRLLGLARERKSPATKP